MKYIKNFKIFEARAGITAEDWAGEWQELPEWKLLQLMGFSIVSTNNNGTVTIHSPYSKVPHRLTAAGYVRTASQGYAYQDTNPVEPMPGMLGYVITRYAKKGIPLISTDALDSLMKANPGLIKYLADLPKIKDEVLNRTGISDPLGDLYKKYGLTPSTIRWLDKGSRKTWKINETTGKIDVGYHFRAGGDKLGFRGIKFGEIGYDFHIMDLGLTSLDGAPDKIGGSLTLIGNPELKSLEGVTQNILGNFHCSLNGITSLKGSPKMLYGNFRCSRNKLTSLAGAPVIVGGDFDCSGNMLTTLKGSTLKEVGGSFDCSDNLITTLEGSPQKIGASFNCSRNELTSLKGAPEVVDGSFSCLYNRLTSLEGSPRIIKGYLNCKNNPIATLKGAPLEISTYFLCSSAFSSEYVDVKWDMKGWLEGLNQEPSLFAPFLLAKTGDIDDKYLTPEVMYLIRKNAPEVFDILAKRMGDGASTLADLGEVGF